MDGNGRVGRLLLTLLLCDWGLLDQPLLYLSAYFERNRQTYYRLLLEVSQRGAWADWIAFFLRGVADQSDEAVRRAQALQDLWRADRDMLQRIGVSGRVLQLVDQLFVSPATSIPLTSRQLGLSYRGAQLVVEKLLEHRVLTEVPAQGRTRVFVAPHIMQVMTQPMGAGPPA